MPLEKGRYMKKKTLYKLNCTVNDCGNEYEKDYYIFSTKRPTDSELFDIQDSLGDIKGLDVEVHNCVRPKNQNETLGYVDYDYK